MKVIIAGGRDFKDFSLLKAKFLELIKTKDKEDKDITIISGTARGADKLGILLSIMLYINLEKYPANWSKYGKSAGYRRNHEMANNATHLLAFWDGKSKGTKHMIDIATQKGLQVTVVPYSN